jgi:hypothetical protein
MTVYKAPEGFDVFTACLCLALAGFGGLMSYLMRTLDAGKVPTWPRALLEGASATFIGMLIYLVCAALKWDSLWTGAMAGLSGWIGAATSSRILEVVILKRFGLSSEQIKQLQENSDGLPK